MQERKRIHIDIQSLLDVRQSVLVDMMGEKAAQDYVSSKTYYARERDEFDVDMQVFAKRVKDYRAALSHATITYVEVILNTKISSLEKLNVFNGDAKQLEILLNIYPFQVDESLANLLRDGLFSKLTTPVHITVINEPIEHLTPVFIKQNNIVEFFHYDAAAWLSKHTESLSKTQLRDSRLHFPALGKQELNDKDRKEIKRLGFADIYQYTEFLYSAVTKINFLPVGFYSNIAIGTLLLEQVAKQEAKDLSKHQPQEMSDVDLSQATTVS